MIHLEHVTLHSHWKWRPSPLRKDKSVYSWVLRAAAQVQGFLFLGRAGRTIAMADCNRNYVFSKLQPFTELHFIWLCNLKFVEHRKSIFLIQKDVFCLRICDPVHFATGVDASLTPQATRLVPPCLRDMCPQVKKEELKRCGKGG